MKNGSLHRRLQKANGKHSVVLSIRFPVVQVEILDEIEKQTSERYDWLIREMVSQFLKLWDRDKPRIKKPLYVFVFNYDDALQKGLIEPDGEIKEKADQKIKEKKKGSK